MSAKKRSPWYESNLFWGSIGLTAAIVLTVVAAMIRDLRLLLWLAWLSSWLTVWAITKSISSPKLKKTCFIFGVLFVGAFLYLLNIRLEPKITQEPGLSKKDLQDAMQEAFSRLWKSEPSKVQTKSEPTKPNAEKPEVLSPAQVVSLYRLFKEDVPGIKSIDFQSVRLHVQSSSEVFGVEPRLHADFVGLSKFVSFYVPSSPAVRDIIRFIADNYSTLTGIDQMELILTKPGEYPRSTETMKFTGSIVIYHEDALSNADLATLENYYNERKVTPIWRGLAYLQAQILLRHGREALERLSKVPPAMQTPKDKLLVVTGITAGVDGERIVIRNKGPRATP